MIKYETKIHLVKDYKQKGGVLTNRICSVTGNELNRRKIPKHMCWICSQLPRKEIKDHFFKASKINKLNSCLGRDFYTTGEHRGYPIGYYHCKSKIWICHNCKVMFDIDFHEDHREIREKIMILDKESLSIGYKFIGFKFTKLLPTENDFIWEPWPWPGPTSTEIRKYTTRALNGFKTYDNNLNKIKVEKFDINNQYDMVILLHI